MAFAGGVCLPFCTFLFQLQAQALVRLERRLGQFVDGHFIDSLHLIGVCGVTAAAKETHVRTSREKGEGGEGWKRACEGGKGGRKEEGMER